MRMPELRDVVSVVRRRRGPRETETSHRSSEGSEVAA